MSQPPQPPGPYGGPPPWGPPPEQPPPQGPPPSWGPPPQGPPAPWGAPPPWGAPAGQPGQPAPQPWQPAPSGEWQQPPQWQVPQGPWDHLGPPAPPAQRRRSRAPLLAAVVTAAVIGGGTATYLAVSDTNSGYHGAASPKEAVTSLVADLNKSDLLGILDHLPPGERSSLLEPMKESISQAKRLHVLKASASGSQITGLDVTAKNITFDQSDESINDHVAIVKLTGGTVTVNTDLSKVPFTDEYLKLAFPNGLPSNSASHQTIDIASLVRDNGEPLRLAAQRVGGKWYPSIAYTVADSIVHSNGGRNPTPADYVAPKGAASAEDAVRQAVDALAKGDPRRLIELTSPDELAVVHDYGGLLIDSAGPDDSTFTVKDLQLTTKNVSGATRVSLKSITVDASGHETTVTVAGDCLEITEDGDHRKLCAQDLFEWLNAGPLGDKPLTVEEKAALTRLAHGVANIGIDATSSNGQWYLNPVRSNFDISNTLAESLQDNDLIVLLGLFAR